MPTELHNRRVVRVPDVAGMHLSKARILLEDDELPFLVHVHVAEKVRDDIK